MNDRRDSDRVHLLDAIDYLTIDHIVTTRRDDAPAHNETHEGLIKQLRDAVASSIGGGAGGKPARERIPLDADALTKYEQIEGAILERFADRQLGVPALLPEENLRKWYVVFMQNATEEQITDEWHTLEGWRRTIEEKLSPPTVRELAGQECPQCGFAWYTTLLNAAVADGKNPKHRDLSHSKDPDWYWVDEERKPALTVTYRPDMTGGLTESFAKCGNCNHVWLGASGIRALAYGLENPVTEIADTPTGTE